MNQAPERWTEYFEVYTKDESNLLDEIRIMEDNSVWTPGLQSKAFEIEPIPTPIEAPEIINKFNLDTDLTVENASEGTKLLLKSGNTYFNISGCCRPTLYATAKISGSALGRMEPIPLAEVLNHALDVARGTTLMLLRYNKVMALHSDAESGYCIMPISSLIDIAKKSITKNFGRMKFQHGFTSNSYTQAVWTLPDAQKGLNNAYHDAVANAVTNLHAGDLMPAVKFSASDTQQSSAILSPMFKMPNGVYMGMGIEISVRHEKRGSPYGMDKFEEEADNLFAKFQESVEAIKKLSEITINNPVNTLVGICNRLGADIPRKYADAAREEVAFYAINSPVMSAHDIFISMAMIAESARQANASKGTIMKIEEAVAKTVNFDWKEFDVGGVVAWGGASK